MKLSSKLARFFACLSMLGLSYAQLYTGTDSTGAWNTSRWSTDSVGPYTSAFSSNSAVVFNNGAYTFTGMGSTVAVGNITLTNNSTVAFSASSGSLLLSAIRTYSVGTGSTLDFGSQAFTTSSTGGIIKNGDGVLALTGGSYRGGFTLNAGTVVANGVSALGGGGTGASVLTLNGGVLASSTNVDFTTSNFGTITMGGNVQIGQLSSITSLANSDASMSFAAALNLGAANRTLTLGNNGVHTFNGVISGSAGVTFAANANTSGRFDITNAANTFSGDITITGGQVRFTGDGSLGNSANDVIIDGGAFSSANNSSFTLGAGRTIFVGDGAGSGINTEGSLTKITVTNGIANKSGETGILVKQGIGDLDLLGANTYTGSTTIAGGTLRIKATGSLSGGSYSGNISIASNSLFEFDSTANQTLSGVIGGAGNLLVTLGTIKLTGSNTLSGSYTVANGAALDLANNAALNGATALNLQAGAILDNSSAGTINIENGSMTKTMTDALTYRGTAGRTLNLGTTTMVLSENNPTMNFTVNGGNLTLAGNFNSASSLAITKNGSGTLQFDNLQSDKLAGLTTINGGTLSIVSNNNLGSTVSFDVKTGAALSLNGSMSFDSYTLRADSQLINTNTTVNANAVFAGQRTLTSADALTNGRQTINAGVTINATSDLFGTTPDGFVEDRIVMGSGSQIRSTGDLAIHQDKGISLLAGSATLSTETNDSLAVNSVISGSGGLTIAAEGSQGVVELNGLNTYLGETYVSSGTLLVNGGLGQGMVIVDAGATVGGIGTIQGDVLFFEDSYLQVSDFANPLKIQGSVIFAGTFGIANLKGINWSEIAHGRYTLIETVEGINDFSISGISNYGIENMVGIGNGNAAYFDNGSLALVVVPEPRAALLGGLGLLLILRRRRHA